MTVSKYTDIDQMSADKIDLERALLKVVDAEIELMHSFSTKQLPVDIATTVAMRMSRAVVSSICRLGEMHPGSLTAASRATLQASAERLLELSDDFEHRIQQSGDKKTLLNIWIA